MERRRVLSTSPSAIHFRAKLSRGGIAIKRSGISPAVSRPRALVTSATSLSLPLSRPPSHSRRSPFSLSPSHPPSPIPTTLLFLHAALYPARRVSQLPSPGSRALRRPYSPPCRIQMSLFSGPLRSALLHNRARLRGEAEGEKKITAVGGGERADGDGW